MLTYVTFFSSWAAVALGLSSPWIVRLLTTPDFYGGERVVPLLVFAFVVFGMYVVVVTSIGRAGRRGSNWMITGAAALFNVALNLILIPPYGMTRRRDLDGRLVLRDVPRDHVEGAAGLPGDLPVAARGLRDRDGGRPRRRGQGSSDGLPAAIGLTAAYPFVLALTGFYLPQERARIGAFGRRFMLGRV